MPLIRVKREDVDLVNAQAEGVQDGSATVPSTAKSNVNNVNPSTLVLSPSAMQLTPQQASRVRFPPGCCVLNVNPPMTPPALTTGTVKSVSIDFGQSNELIYCISTQRDGSDFEVNFKEANLQWGPTCSVWVRPKHFAEEQPDLPAVIVAVVLGSVQAPDKIYYAVADANDPLKMLHVLAEECIVQYRPVENVADTRLVSAGTSGQTEDLETPAGSPNGLQVQHAEKRPLDQSSCSITKRLRTAPGITENENDSLLSAGANVVPEAPALGRPIMRNAPSDRLPLEDESSPTPDQEPKTRLFVPDSNLQEDELSPSATFCSTATSDETISTQDSMTLSRTCSNPRTQGDAKGTRTVSIPRMLDADMIKKALIGPKGVHHKKLERRIRCNFSVRGYPIQRDAHEGDPLCIEVRGSERYLDTAVEQIENALVRGCPQDDRGRLLYHLAKANKTAENSDGIAAFQR